MPVFEYDDRIIETRPKWFEAVNPVRYPKIDYDCEEILLVRASPDIHRHVRRRYFSDNPDFLINTVKAESVVELVLDPRRARRTCRGPAVPRGRSCGKCSSTHVWVGGKPWAIPLVGELGSRRCLVCSGEIELGNNTSPQKPDLESRPFDGSVGGIYANASQLYQTGKWYIYPAIVPVEKLHAKIPHARVIDTKHRILFDDPAYAQRISAEPHEKPRAVFREDWEVPLTAPRCTKCHANHTNHEGQKWPIQMVGEHCVPCAAVGDCTECGKTATLNQNTKRCDVCDAWAGYFAKNPPAPNTELVA